MYSVVMADDDCLITNMELANYAMIMKCCVNDNQWAPKAWIIMATTGLRSNQNMIKSPLKPKLFSYLLNNPVLFS